MMWHLNHFSNSWEWVTSELTVEEWCGDSAEVRNEDLENSVSVKIGKIKFTIPMALQSKVFKLIICTTDF